ncbi:MAG: serine hydrolase [Candidatus Pacebacteria bacterium]|nr:serine hydrolase [Candidatus Paceibacterota bacterium]PIR63751.1 MAG: hypothetical protein COU64_02135 [Candidatus Pacebacteria bacterium CG10_big_fil_rev_8_21_14_0_10_40_26]PIZ78537.1 MAG: hypothetical protein COY01_04820 [Candidatus Pacebacteria bacterium CG_4_10_14_0_2_um_filter_40_20]PJA69388.1 MAG: hypothetical protein CO156_00710 [Candidatus Pacebacteria bacterium CG_4_9_14_3_um_filter_40_12]PJC41405.1 MAG: hypothetical protein CO041_04695 [Candidatus Pacebacteria bacterium CG_4_9_14_0
MKYISLLILSSVLFFIVGIAISPYLKKGTSSTTITEKRETGYKLINPLLECAESELKIDIHLQSVKNKLEDTIKSRHTEEVSVYYRDLNNGPWFGINEETTFSPQSLLKLPIAMSYYKKADLDPNLLSSELTYSEEIPSNRADQPSLELGKSYSVQSLIERALVLSDNQAFNMLTNSLSDSEIKKTHDDLGIPFPSATTPQNFVSVRSYASLFRVLFNASYLSWGNSEKILQLLTTSDFDDGLKAGVPSDIIVAHKYGISHSQELKQLHDCGIIYNPNRPYVLCIMTKGTNISEQQKTIQELSKIVFEGLQ